MPIPANELAPFISRHIQALFAVQETGFLRVQDCLCRRLLRLVTNGNVRRAPSQRAARCVPIIEFNS